MLSAPPTARKAMGQLRSGRSICPSAEGEGEQLPLSVRLSVAGECGGPRGAPLLRPRCGSSQPSLEGQGRGTGTAEGVRSGSPPGAGLRGHREETLGGGGLRGALGAGETPAVGFCMGLPLERGEGFIGGCGPGSHTHTHLGQVRARRDEKLKGSEFE